MLSNPFLKKKKEEQLFLIIIQEIVAQQKKMMIKIMNWSCLLYVFWEDVPRIG